MEVVAKELPALLTQHERIADTILESFVKISQGVNPVSLNSPSASNSVASTRVQLSGVINSVSKHKALSDVDPATKSISRLIPECSIRQSHDVPDSIQLPNGALNNAAYLSDSAEGLKPCSISLTDYNEGSTDADRETSPRQQVLNNILPLPTLLGSSMHRAAIKIRDIPISSGTPDLSSVALAALAAREAFFSRQHRKFSRNTCQI